MTACRDWAGEQENRECGMVADEGRRQGEKHGRGACWAWRCEFIRRRRGREVLGTVSGHRLPSCARTQSNCHYVSPSSLSPQTTSELQCSHCTPMYWSGQSRAGRVLFASQHVVSTPSQNSRSISDLSWPVFHLFLTERVSPVCSRGKSPAGAGAVRTQGG